MNHEDLKQIKEKLISIIYFHTSFNLELSTYDDHEATRAQHAFIREPKAN